MMLDRDEDRASLIDIMYIFRFTHCTASVLVAILSNQLTSMSVIHRPILQSDVTHMSLLSQSVELEITFHNVCCCL